MKISAKLDYACKAVLELSLHWPSPIPLGIQTIAKRQNIPIKFLTHILIVLKENGVVQSLRGKAGGYLLTREPKEIRLSDITRAFGFLSHDGRLVRENKGGIIQAIWREISEKLGEAVEEITFEAICNRQCCKDNVMTYEI